MLQYLVRYLFISSAEKKQLLHKFFIEMANLYPPLSDWKHQVYSKEESDSGSECLDDRKNSSLALYFSNVSHLLSSNHECQV